MAAPILQFKRGLSTTIAGSGVSFKAGEPGFTTDKYDFYIGLDGTSANNKFFGSARYWIREDGNTAARLNFVDKTGIGGTIQLKAPDTQTGIVTYTLPGSISANNYLTVDATGQLSWAAINTVNLTNTTLSGVTTISGSLNVTANSSFTGITTLGVTSTSSLTSQQLIVSGLSTFSGVTTHTAPIFGTQASFTGVVTATTFSGNATSASYANSAGIATYATSAGIATYSTSSGIATAVSGGLASVTQLNVTGLSTFSGIATHTAPIFGTQGFFTGVVTATTFSGTATNAGYSTSSGISTAVSGGLASVTQLNVTGLSTFSGIATYTAPIFGTQGFFTGVVTATTFSGTATNAGYSTSSGIATAVSGGLASVTQLNVTGLSTFSGIATYTAPIFGTQGFFTGVVTATTFSGNATSASYANSSGIATYATSAGISTYSTSSGIATAVSGGLASVTQLNVTGLSTFSGIATHTAPIFGTQGFFTGVVTATTFSGNATSASYANSAGIATYATSAGISTAVSGGLASVTQLNVTGLSTFSGIATYTAPIFGTQGFFTGVVTATTFSGNATSASYATSSGIATYATSAGVSTNVSTTQTSTNLPYPILFGTNNTSTSSETVRVGTGLSFNPSSNTLFVQNAQHSAINALDGTSAITISNTTGAVGFANSVTISGNLFVNGTTTQVNTTELQVYDRTITLGIQSGTAPTSTSWDLGIMMDYGSAGVAQTAGVVWKTNGLTSPRFQFAANVDNPTVGVGTTVPVETIGTSSFAPIEIKELWISDTASSASAVISYLAVGQLYTGSIAGRYLQNITVDCGTF